MKKRFSLFYIIYFSLVVIFIIALAAGLGFLHSYLSEFESSRTDKVMEEVIREYFLTDDKKPLLLKSGYDVPKYSSITDVIEYLESAVSADDLEYYAAAGESGEKAVYNVVSNGLKVASVELSKTGEVTKHGFEKYSLSGITLTIGGASSVTVDAPERCRVFVNGYELTDSELTGETVETESCRHMWGDAVGIKYVTYKLDGLFGEPKVSAKDINTDTVSEVIKDEDGTSYSVLPSYGMPDDALSERILTAAERYAAYMQGDMPFSKISPYMDKESLLYENLRTSDLRWVTEHNGCSAEDPELSEFYFYSDDVFSCRVKFTHVLYGYGGNNYEEKFDETFYFRNVNGTFLIYDSYNN